MTTKDEKNDCLKTTWETPEICPYCMEHLSKDWSFCPECGRPTDWSENQPVTFSDILDMDGKPLWVKNLVTDKVHDEWALVSVSQQYLESIRNLYYFKDYGCSWIAYRSRPKE